MTPRHKISKLEREVEKTQEILLKVYQAQIGLSKIIDILIKKGLITHDEIKSAFEEANSKRTEKQPSSNDEPANLDAGNDRHIGDQQEVPANESNGTVEPGNAENKS